MCLKLVKHLDSIDRLPINHTVFKKLVEKESQKHKDAPPIDAKSLLFSEFERAQKAALLATSTQKYDPDSGLPFCLFHPDRVEHFYCETHRVTRTSYEEHGVQDLHRGGPLPPGVPHH